MNSFKINLICFISLLFIFGCQDDPSHKENSTNTLPLKLDLQIPIVSNTIKKADPAQFSADIKPFLEKYFSTWSNRKIEEYKSCFHDSAVIIQIYDGEVLSSIDLEDFIRRQRNYFAQARGPVVEKMTSFRVDEDPYSANISVKWVLERDGKSWTGVDRFSLIRDKDKNWKIVALLWYKNKSQSKQ